MEEITVIRENDEVIAHIFVENGEIKAILENGFKVMVDGVELEKDSSSDEPTN